MSSKLTSTSSAINTVYSDTVQSSTWLDKLKYSNVYISSSDGRLPELTTGQIGFYTVDRSDSNYDTIYGPDDSTTYMVFAVSDTQSTIYNKNTGNKFNNVVFLGCFKGAVSYGLVLDGGVQRLILIPIPAVS